MNDGIGQPISRLDGRAKVTGSARYSADTQISDVAFAIMVPATIPKGTIASLDMAAAEQSPGVLRVFTHRNAPRLGPVSGLPAGQNVLPLQGERIFYEGQPIALVVGDTLENATAAARLVRATYRDDAFETDFLTRLDRGEALPSFGVPPDATLGDVAAARAAAAVTLEKNL